MSKSKLLKEAIADAKAVRETAIANAKIALEEAFTPRLQSILSKKIQAEAEDMEDEIEVNEEYGADDVSAADSSEIGAGEGSTESGTNGAAPTGIATDAHTELGDTDTETAQPGDEDGNLEVVDTLTEEEEEMEFDSTEEAPVAEEDEDELDLEAIIRELEAQLGGDEEGTEDEFGAEDDAMGQDPMAENLADGSEAGTDKGETPKVVVTNEEAEEDDKKDDVIDLEEILREMEADLTNEAEESNKDEKEEELKEAYSTIKSLQKTINEVNLLNAKLLFANKLFRAHNMTNEQKVKVIETLDRTNSVREVKLVYSTLAENFKYTSISKTAKKSITEGIASKVVKSTAPKTEVKQVIAESTDFSDRFKKLAGIIK